MWRASYLRRYYVVLRRRRASGGGPRRRSVWAEMGAGRGARPWWGTRAWRRCRARAAPTAHPSPRTRRLVARRRWMRPRAPASGRRSHPVMELPASGIGPLHLAAVWQLHYWLNFIRSVKKGEVKEDFREKYSEETCTPQIRSIYCNQSSL